MKIDKEEYEEFAYRPRTRDMEMLMTFFTNMKAPSREWNIYNPQRLRRVYKNGKTLWFTSISIILGDGGVSFTEKTTGELIQEIKRFMGESD